MRFVMLAWLAVTTVGGCRQSASETDPADREMCEQFRAHIVDLRLANMTDADVQRHRANMIDAFGDRFISACTSSMTVAQARCAIEAENAESAEACTSERAAK